MPEIDADGMAHYDMNDPEDLAILIDRGFIWKGGPKAYSLAIDAIVSGKVPRPTRNVPDDVNRYLDSQNVPVGSGGEELAPPAEPEDEDLPLV